MKNYFTERINELKKDKNTLKLIAISVLLFGGVAHGYVMLNKFCFHDEARCITHIGMTVQSGRWMLQVLMDITTYVLGSSLFSTPFFNACVSFFFIMLMAYDIVSELSIKKRLSIILLCGCLTTFPYVTSLFGYMYAAPFYMLGTWLAIKGTRLACGEKRSVIRLVTGAAMCCCSVGVYQASIPVILSFIVLILISNELNVKGKVNFISNTVNSVNPVNPVNPAVDRDFNDKVKPNPKSRKEFKSNNKNHIVGNQEWMIFIKYSAWCICFVAAFMIGYFVVNTVFLNVRGEELLEYQGISGFGKTTFLGYIERIVIAYREFISPSGSWFGNMYPNSLFFLYPVLVILTYVWILMQRLHYSQTIGSNIRLGMLLIVLPLACNFIYVMCDEETVHSLMMYAEVMFLVFVISVFERSSCHRMPSLLGRMLEKAVIVMVAFFLISYVRFANVCTLKGQLLQNNFISYCNVLISNIESTEGYYDGIPVMYIGEFDKNENGSKVPSEFWNTNVFPYNYNSIINNYAWKDTMRIWCGFNPRIVEVTDEYEKDARITEMPLYPSKGSIKEVDGVMVVKFSR